MKMNMARMSNIIAALILAATLANAARQPWDIHDQFIWLFSNEDSPSSLEKALAPIRKNLEARGLFRLGYRIEPGSIWDKSAGEYFLIQYTMSPIVLRPHTTEDEWVLM